MNKKPVLSICIPNYNRGELLLKNLEAIADQVSNEPVEVVISDDHSKENIAQKVNSFRKKKPHLKLKFVRQRKNLGFDKNVLEVVRLSRGKYCWLLSNDDIIRPDGIGEVLKTIEANSGVSLILVNYSRYDFLAAKVTAKRMIALSKSIVYKDADNFFFTKTSSSYFKFLGVNTITMSCDVFDRSAWIKTLPRIKKYIGHNFIHVFAIVTLMKSNPKVVYMASPLVQYLSNNHRTWPNDIWRDYNQFLLGYMLELGYSKNKIKKAKKIQKEYEMREAFTKMPWLIWPYQSAIRVGSKIKKYLLNG